MTPRKIGKIITTLLAIGFIVLGTIVMVMYARGYRFDRTHGTVEQTGVLNIESDPFRTTVFIDGKEIGRTPRTITSLKAGMYQVEVLRDKYLPWKKDVEVVASKSTPIYPHLFLETPVRTEVFSIDDQIVDVIHPARSDYIFIITSRDISEGETGGVDADDNVNETTGEKTELYRIWRYDTNPSFWESSSNPRLFYEEEQVDLESFQFFPSHNGEHALLTIGNSVQAEDEVEESSETAYTTYIVDTSVREDGVEKVDLEGFVDGYEISWSFDNNYLILSSPQELISVEVNSKIKYLLRSRSNELVWTTDGEGNFYYVEYDVDKDSGVKFMRIMFSTLTGTSPEPIVERIYYIEDNQFLMSQEELLQLEQPREFTNSPANPQFAGKIKSFKVESAADALVVKTDFATYLYSLVEDRYLLVNDSPVHYLGLAPDLKRFLFEDLSGSLLMFIFDKEEADHTVKLGTHMILKRENGGQDSDEVGDQGDDKANDTNLSQLFAEETLINPSIKWHNNSRILFYRENGLIKSIDSDGDNNYELLTVGEHDLFVKDASGENLFLLETDKEKVGGKLVRYKVN